MGCDRTGLGHRDRTAHFNPRTPVGCDHRTCCSTNPRPRFQSTHPSGVRPCPGRHGIPQSSDFNPRTPVGCDLRELLRRVDEQNISIHAPQWGATQGRGPVAGHPTNFNPRTPVGCDLSTLPPTPSNNAFQSTHPSGVRPFNVIGDVGAGVFQSTHPSGVRPNDSARTSMVVGHFNPRTPVGCDNKRCIRP